MSEPSPKQSAFLAKNGATVPATAAEASDMISKIYRDKGFAEKPRESRPAYGASTKSRDYSNSPPTDKMIAALKKADWYTPNMLSGEARKRLDILANNNWRKPENVAGPDTVDADLQY